MHFCRRFMCVPFVMLAGCAATGPSLTPTPRTETTLICGSPEERATRGATNPPLCEPPVIRSVDRQLDTPLAVNYAANQIGDVPVCLRSYEGGLLGPTWRVKPGDVMNIHVDNQLPETPNSSSGHAGHQGSAEQDVNDPHGFNVTNLHTHGLHVSPDGNADNVLISFYPGDQFSSEIYVPTDHAPGNHWYHAHHHGSVALQVASSLAGSLIIEGGLDDRLNEYYSALGQTLTERLLAVQQPFFSIDDGSGNTCNEQDGSVTGVNVATTYCGYPSSKGVGCLENYDFDRNQPTTINGQVQPKFTMKAGQVERWRILHAGIESTLNLAVIKAGPNRKVDPDIFFEAMPGDIDMRTLAVTHVPINVVAEDGIAYGNRELYDNIPIDSGYRLDLLIRIDEPGIYHLVDLATSAQDSLLEEAEESEVLMMVEVSSETDDMPLPPQSLFAGLAPYQPIPDSELYAADPCLQLEYKAASPRFFINGHQYDPAAPACKVPLHSAQEWRLSSRKGNHPHHIHVNPFRVENPPDDRRHGPVWKDTWLVRASDSDNGHGPVRIRTRYQRYIGDFVLHCHILNHEDRGMMQEVEIDQHPPPARDNNGVDPVTAGTLCLRCQ